MPNYDPSSEKQNISIEDIKKSTMQLLDRLNFAVIDDAEQLEEIGLTTSTNSMPNFIASVTIDNLAVILTIRVFINAFSEISFDWKSIFINLDSGNEEKDVEQNNSTLNEFENLLRLTLKRAFDRSLGDTSV